MKKLNFALDVTAIDEWVNDLGQEMLEKEILAGETISYIKTKSGVKYKEQLKYIDTDAIHQAWSCGRPTTSGTTTITAKDVEVKHFRVYEELCPTDIDDTMLSLSQSSGLDTDLPFAGQYTQLKSKKIKSNIEKEMWVQASGATNIAGFLNQFDADSDVVDYVYDFSATGITNANLIAAYEAMIDKIPEELISMEDLTLFLGHDQYRKLSRAFLDTNNVLLTKFDFNGVEGGISEFPGSEFLKIRPVSGLNKANNPDARCVITPASNLLFVTDMISEEDKVTMRWSEDDQIIKWNAQFKFGPAYYFGAYVVNNQKS